MLVRYIFLMLVIFYVGYIIIFMFNNLTNINLLVNQHKLQQTSFFVTYIILLMLFTYLEKM